VRTRVIGGVVAALVVMGLVPAVAKADPPDPCAPVLACGDDLSAMETLEAKIDDHLVYGQVLEASFAGPERTPGTVTSLGGWGDSGLWTGTYLAAQSYRYATAGKYLADPEVVGEARDFWTGQRAEALARVQAMVAKYHLLTNIGSTWRTSTRVPPYVTQDPTDPNDRTDFGGGIIQGEPGMLMRACAPTDAPPQWAMGQNKRVFELPSDPNATWTDGKRYFCETAPSRDTYAGTTFGLLAAFDLVSGEDPAMRASIRDDILTLGNFLLKYGWNYPRPHGFVSAPPVGHDFDNFASPLFTYVPMARLNLTNAARHVASVAGSAEQQAQWQAVWAEELASQGPLLGASMEIDAVQPNAGYYKFNLHHLTGLNLFRFVTNPVEQLLVKQAIGVMDKTTGDDVNAHFEAITYAMTGEPARLDAAVQHLREWRSYRSRTDTGVNTVNSTKCGISIQCVPDDQYDVMVDPGLDVTVPGTVAKQRARFPLPVADRPPTDFLWQRPPTQLDGSSPAHHEAPGIDYLLPYWMLRYYTEVAPPALAPFPAWPGPSHQ
jgi:hypothetical protein